MRLSSSSASRMTPGPRRSSRILGIRAAPSWPPGVGVLAAEKSKLAFLRRVQMVLTHERMATAAGRIVTMLPSTPQVEAVYLDEAKGILAGLADLPPDPGNLSLSADGTGSSQASIHTILIDQTTLDPTVAMSIAKTVQERSNGKAAMVDAPVSGGTFYFNKTRTRLIRQALSQRRLGA